MKHNMKDFDGAIWCKDFGFMFPICFSDVVGSALVFLLYLNQLLLLGFFGNVC